MRPPPAISLGRHRRTSPGGRQRLEERLDVARGTCFCLLYDLNAWLARAPRPVPLRVREYGFAALRQIADPRERLGQYVAQELMEAWEQALRPFFEAGSSLVPRLGDDAALSIEGLEGEGPPCAELRFVNGSSVVDAADQRHVLPRREWLLQIRLAASLDRVEDADLTPV